MLHISFCFKVANINLSRIFTKKLHFIRRGKHICFFNQDQFILIFLGLNILLCQCCSYIYYL